ncbi:hypothetical protein [Halegenticoccus soli]|uniref:hypothetical protein n=1 Tax=Halegenticoccus soli TaxID=1985678 RepID=UPI00117B3407|nr:hypothetical protein [Halegenticoccus soli]
MVPLSGRQLIRSLRPVGALVLAWAAVVLFSEFGVKNVGYSEPGSLIWWLGTLITAGATVVAAAGVLLYVLAQGIRLGLGVDPVGDSNGGGGGGGCPAARNE